MARMTKAEIEAAARVRWDNERKVKAARGVKALGNIQQILMQTVGLPAPAEVWINEVLVIKQALD